MKHSCREKDYLRSAAAKKEKKRRRERRNGKETRPSLREQSRPRQSVRLRPKLPSPSYHMPRRVRVTVPLIPSLLLVVILLIISRILRDIRARQGGKEREG